MRRSTAEILREYGPFPGVDQVHGVTFDGRQVWFAVGERLNALDPASGEVLRSLDVAALAGTAFDGEHLFQIAGERIQKIDPQTGRVLATIPAPDGGGIRGSPGPKERSGWGSIMAGESIRSIPRPGRSSAPSSPTASSPGSPGSTANSGMAPGKTTGATCGISIRSRARCWSSSTCRPERACRARVRWRRPVLLRRRRQRQAADVRRPR